MASSIVVTTQVLKTMVDKLNRCGVSRFLEITKYWLIQVSDDGMVMRATDGSNFIEVTDSSIKGNLEAIVRADQFGKLVDRTSVDKMTLRLTDNFLEVEGNGKYKVDVVMNETFPEPPRIKGEKYTIDSKSIRQVSAYNECAVSAVMADGCLTGYYIDGDAAVTTDGIKFCRNPIKILKEPALLTSAMMDLLAALTDDKITVVAQDNLIEFSSASAVVYGAQLDGMDDYPDVSDFVDPQFDFSVRLPKVILESVLDRLNLFVNKFDKNEVILRFFSKFVEVRTVSDSYERINYADKKGLEDFEGMDEPVFQCSLNSVFFSDLIKVVQGDHLWLHFGDESMVQLTDGPVACILATGEMEE